MSSQNFFNKGQNDASSGKGAASTSGLNYQGRQGYDAGYRRQQQQQQNQSGKKD